MSLLLKILLMRRPLIEVSIVHSFFFFFIYIVFFTIGLATIKENKEKAVASGTEGEKDV